MKSVKFRDVPIRGRFYFKNRILMDKPGIVELTEPYVKLSAMTYRPVAVKKHIAQRARIAKIYNLKKPRVADLTMRVGSINATCYVAGEE